MSERPDAESPAQPSVLLATERLPDELAALEVSPPPSAARAATLTIYSRDATLQLSVERSRPLSVGRGRPSDIVIRDRGLSREHARFVLDDEDTLWVEDLGSTNGTRINGERVTRAALRVGDDLRVGSTAVVLASSSGGADGAAGSGPTLTSHGELLTLLDYELRRARTFGRGAALLCFRGERSGGAELAHVRHFADGVRALLRPADVVAVYGPGALLAALPEVSPAEARMVAQQALASTAARLSLRCGLAVYPDDGASADALVDRAREALHSTSAARPLARVASGKPRVALSSAPIIASSAMRAVYDTARRVAPTTLPVLIRGETGAGKELLAQALHAGSGRSGALHTINCGAIPSTLIESTLFGHERGAFTGADQRREGLFEDADGATLLLDEVGELPAPAQAALLRVLETKRIRRVGGSRETAVDVRVVAATHRDLEAMCTSGAFREDLLYRLNTITLCLPALRQQPDAIVALAQRFLEQANADNKRCVRAIDDEAMSLLTRYGWPGNVRELRNVIERAVVLAPGDIIGADELGDRIGRLRARTLVVDSADGAESTDGSAGVRRPDERPEAGATEGAQPASIDLQKQIDRYEIELILAALEQSGWNQSEAARRLNVPRKRIQRKLAAHGIRRPLEEE